jgi:hypothetical protein
MDIEKELLSHLDKILKESKTKQRNIEIVVFYYGFSDAVWPTLDEVAKQYSIGTRERVRQILNKNFRDFTKKNDLPSVVKCAEILSKGLYITASDYLKKLEGLGLVWSGGNVQGLLNLMHDLGLAETFHAYTQDLRLVTRGLLTSNDETYLLEKSDAEELKEALKNAKDLPGMLGIANLKYLNEDWSNEKFLFVKDVIQNSTEAWFKEDDKDFWYIFEKRDNTLINYSEKVFRVIDSCKASYLAEVYENALYARSNKYKYPPVKIIEEYLKKSVFFESDGDLIEYKGSTRDLTDIESDIVKFFNNEPRSNFKNLNSHLEAIGYTRPHISKATMFSPLVHVDKTRGRKQYIYSLVQKAASIKTLTISARYQSYLNRLRKLIETGTDESIEGKRRKEHAILQEWLFKDKKTEHCAICGELYEVSALVTAHKKKRAKCTAAERLDPYIVMPICLFGCDYLYERGFLYISKGRITVNTKMKSETIEYSKALELNGKTLKDEWLNGSESYFYK